MESDFASIRKEKLDLIMQKLRQVSKKSSIHLVGGFAVVTLPNKPLYRKDEIVRRFASIISHELESPYELYRETDDSFIFKRRDV